MNNQSSNIKVSIIVPAYNALSTINRCIASLIGQTLQNIEIICVNDCSTDETLLILNEWYKMCPEKIVVISTPTNLGAGGARNLGVSIARGEYIGFVDSDDYVHSTMYEKMYNEAIKTNYDIIDTGFYNETKDSAIILTPPSCVGVLDPDMRNQLIVSGGYIWSKLFKKSLFSDSNYTFRENCILEDADFLAYAYASINSIGAVQEVLYFYCNQSNSLSKERNPEQYHHHIITAMHAIYEKLYTIPHYNTIRDSAEYMIFQLYAYGVINIAQDYIGSRQVLNPLESLQALRTLRFEHIKDQETPYHNQFCLAKIPKDSLQLCSLNDNAPEILLNSIHRK